MEVNGVPVQVMILHLLAACFLQGAQYSVQYMDLLLSPHLNLAETLGERLG